MPKKKKAEQAQPFAVHQCSLCEEFDLTFGEQYLGGVRWCQTCLKHSFGWFQMSEEDRQRITDIFDTLRSHPNVLAQLAYAQTLTPEQKKANAIGESNRRLVEANRREYE